ncbi:hypothetical protein A4H97_13210 [Niastella yeongjuensis]|uniref:Uncharacterized protein n=1 Tax=Niastella yeongjuensis TaxID=354355 RepID=A0A1V9EAH3_9BACT|nr:hypothetical protein [Niastella yeongjuensis]OQP43096.1 hypothetical protein A4H97_13210 [Niastella yeongjuensis]SEO66284.1 hypothetical protein SAMN05660816_03313 [Niastella yeongjuensis]
MRKLAALLLILTCTLCTNSWAQDTLPKFSVVTKGNKKAIISWVNNYPVVTQISIQRSRDSLKGFVTIMSMADPTAPQNGFVDAKAPDMNQFYRIFVVKNNGQFLFTQSKRPFFDTVKVAVVKQQPENGHRVVIAEGVSEKQAEEIKEKLQPNTTTTTPPPPVVVKPPEPEKFYFVKKRDTLVATINAKELKKFRDSMVTKTKDTMTFVGLDTIVLKPFVPKEVYKPSKFVYTEKDGNVAINLPTAGLHKYSIKFFDMQGIPQFDIDEVKESPLLIDKVNFLRSGWYKFELYEDGKLKEKHRFFIPKD